MNCFCILSFLTDYEMFFCFYILYVYNWNKSKMLLMRFICKKITTGCCSILALYSKRVRHALYYSNMASRFVNRESLFLKYKAKNIPNKDTVGPLITTNSTQRRKIKLNGQTLIRTPPPTTSNQPPPKVDPKKCSLFEVPLYTTS